MLEDFSARRNEALASVSSQYVWQGSQQPSPYSPVGGRLKRAIDIVIAGTTLFLLAPLMLIAAGLIYLTQGGSVVFAQPRVGFGGKMFRCFKFRTMVPDAEERLAAHLAADPEAAREWKETRKLKNDPRVTWLGCFLRKSSIDELPQLINVLRGEMSCIGPRPVVADELARYGVHAEEYAMARPGLTGIWQVSGRSNTTYAQRVQLDRYYARRWSLALDLRILFMTVPALVKISQTA
ncbi:MAG: sugar transferase [Alphaproteobacteria bacterium]